MKNLKLQWIDESLISEHSCLELSDICLFLGTYASGFGFQHSEINDVINNFKKPMDRRLLPEWYYKEQSILKIAYWLVSTKNWSNFKNCTWVPMPPSSVKSDSNYDDRLLRVLLKIKEFEPSLDIRELLLAKSSRESAHNPSSKKKRPTITEHIANFTIDEALKSPVPNTIIVFDDVITSGASFKAAQSILKEYFSNTPIIGVFIARAVNYLHEIG